MENKNDTHRQMLEEFKREIIARKQELGQCLQRQEELETRIAHLQEVAAAVARLIGEVYIPEDVKGLTDAIRQAFKTAPHLEMNAIVVRARLHQMGFDLAKYGNVLAAIHTVLKRLHERGVLIATGIIGNSQGYMWVINPPAPPKPPTEVP
jgi:hypothetical protein